MTPEQKKKSKAALAPINGELVGGGTPVTNPKSPSMRQQVIDTGTGYTGPTAKTMRATSAVSGDTSKGPSAGGSSIRDRVMGMGRSGQGTAGRPMYGDPVQDEITGVVGRADGKQQMYSRGQLSEMAKNVNTVNTSAMSKGEVQEEGGTFDAVRDKLRKKVLAGGIGSRAALDGLLTSRGQDFDREGNQNATDAAMAKAQAEASGTSFDQTLKVSEEQRQRRTDLETSIASRIASEFDMEDVGGDASVGARLGGLTTELLNNIGGTQDDVNGAFNVAKLLDFAVNEAGLPIPLFGSEGNFDLQSLDQIAGINFDAEDENITIYDNKGKAWDIGSDTDLLGLTNFDVTNTDFANLRTAMDKYGIPNSRGPKAKDTPEQFRRN